VPEACVLGRAAELAAVDDLLRGASKGFAALAVVGEPGIGKTTVWREAARRAGEAGACVLSCRPAAAEAKFSFSALTDLLAPVDGQLFALLPEPQRRALEVALMRSAADGARLPPYAAATGLVNLLRQLASSRPVVLAIDDAQWLDGPSRRALEFAFRRLEHDTVGLFYTLRPSTAALDVGAVAEQRRAVLGPLSLATIGQVLASRLGRPLPRPALVRVWQASGGNPFYALEIGRLLAEGGAEHGPGSALPVPADLGELVAGRARRLPARCRQELLLAAVLAAPEGRMLDLDALGPAREQRMVHLDQEKVEFDHPLLAAAVYAMASGAERRAAHLRAAALVGGIEEGARHLALAAEGPDPAIAARLDRAAEAAAGRAAPDAAGELAELAAQLTPEADPTERAARWLRAGSWLFEAGDLERADALARQVLAQGQEPALRAGALRLSAHLHTWREGFADALQLARHALEMAGDDDRLRAALELEVSFYCCQMGDSTAGAAHARAAARHARTTGDQEQLADALALEAWARFVDGSGLYSRIINRARKLERPEAATVLLFRPTWVYANIELLTQQLCGARLAFGDVLAQAVQRGQEADLPILQFHLAEVCLWSGDLSGATSYAKATAELASLLDSPVVSALSLFASALVDAYEGRTEGALEGASRVLAALQETQDQVGVPFAASVAGFAELSAGNPAGAHRALGQLTAQMVGALPRRSLARVRGETGFGDPGFFPFLPDEVEALIALGELGQAEAYLAPFEQSATDLDRPWALAAAGRLRGALHAARGERDLAHASFQQALAAHERLEVPFERGRTLLLAGQAYRRLKQHGRAAQALGEALAVFESLGAPLWAAKARAELARAGRPAAGVGALSETERRLAGLASKGLSNREVAAQAFVSVKTVEANLSRVYRKLGVRSRAALALALALGDEGSPPTHRVRV
jgi:DNA-binding CsgD family transcriptional regulator